MKNYWICLLAIACLMACGGNTNNTSAQEVVKVEANPCLPDCKEKAENCDGFAITKDCAACLRQNFDTNREKFENFKVDGKFLNGFSLKGTDFETIERNKGTIYQMLGMHIKEENGKKQYIPALIIQVGKGEKAAYFNITNHYTGIIDGTDAATAEEDGCPNKGCDKVGIPIDGNPCITKACAIQMTTKFIGDRSAFYNYAAVCDSRHPDPIKLQGFAVENRPAFAQTLAMVAESELVHFLFAMRGTKPDMVTAVYVKKETDGVLIVAPGYYDFTTPCPNTC